MERRFSSLPFFHRPENEAQVSHGVRHPERESGELHIRRFSLPNEVEDRLDDHQKALLVVLEQAAVGMARVYAAQEGSLGSSPFYPSGVSRKAIEKAALTNPEILSPYTVVVRTAEDGLITYPMHEVYRRILERAGVVRSLREAANQAGKGKKKDMAFSIYLKARAKALEDGDYEESEKYWLGREDEPEIDIVIGFFDIYLDRALGIKFAAEAWVGVLDKELTEDSQWFMDSFLNWYGEESGSDAPKIKMRVDHTLVQTGQAARFGWTANSLPCQVEWRQKYGSKFTLFEPSFDLGFEKRLALYRSVIPSTKRMGISDELVRSTDLRRYIGHEISHSLGISESISDRLQGQAPWLKELYCDLLDLKGYSKINGISMREKELALALSFVNGCLNYSEFTRERKKEEYYVASVILLKYCLKQGSVKIENREITWDDPREVFADVSKLFELVDQIQSEGTVKDVRELVSAYFDPSPYDYLTRESSATPSFLTKILGKPPVADNSDTNQSRVFLGRFDSLL